MIAERCQTTLEAICMQCTPAPCMRMLTVLVRMCMMHTFGRDATIAERDATISQLEARLASGTHSELASLREEHSLLQDEVALLSQRLYPSCHVAPDNQATSPLSTLSPLAETEPPADNAAAGRQTIGNGVGPAGLISARAQAATDKWVARARAKGTCHLALPHHLAHLGLSAWHVSLEHRWLAARTKGTAAVGSPTAGDRWR